MEKRAGKSISPPQGGHRCNGPGCTSNVLIKAHIIPAGFARTLHRDGGYNLLVSSDGARRARHQLGTFDKTILCAECDRHLGGLDEYALRLSQSIPSVRRVGALERFEDVDCDRLAAFVTSVVWRAAISREPAFDGINLGPHLHRARDIAFSHGGKGFPVIANRLASPHLNVRQFYVIPARQRLRDLNTYVFMLGGFQFHLIADRRPVPRHLQPLVINGQTELVSLTIPLEGTAEFKEMGHLARSSATNAYGPRR